MNSKAASLSGIALALAIGGYWYWSPFLAVYSMKSAVENRDADSFNQYVDYPQLRESLKGQFSALMTEKLGSAQASGSDFERAGAAFGSMIGLAMVDRVVDGMVRPEMVMRAMAENNVAPNKHAEHDSPTAEPRPKGDSLGWQFSRKGVDKLIIHSAKATGEVDLSTGFVFERFGFASWRLTEIRLPPH